ncbi:MAG: proline--tRNA ligase [Deltaproteobacteria bacterium]|uniref:Proline--tRNA ligase n=1 Tax=Candidatus Zymogenus saltonus TaxID=2844893 RepID=A0A9D8KGM8_9DELT|nr:proline--tRNA ligase [Candidatus Zymogenus saltonus]
MKDSFTRYSNSFINTRREDPGDAEIPSHRLLLRGGFIRQVTAGVFDFTPLAFKVMTRIMAIIRDEMNGIGGQEVLMPVLNPASLWIESERYNVMGPELIRFKDRRGTGMCLAMTNEETVTDLARGYVSSYRDLPFMLYHIQTKIRDEARPRGGLVRVREFLMKDAYSFHRSVADLSEYYVDVYEAYGRIFARMALPSVPVEADSGAMGGSASHEFILPTEWGEDTFASCNVCGMSANVERAEVITAKADEPAKHPGPEKVHTPNMTTIDDLKSFFGIENDRFLKAVAYSYDDGEGSGHKIVIVFINGAYEVNETKLTNRLGAIELDVADPKALEELGIVPGFISPRVAGKKGVTVIFDKTVLSQPVYIVGGDEIDYHIKNFVPGRDFVIDTTIDLATVREGDPCPSCVETGGKTTGKITLKRGIELGHTFQLGRRYSKVMGLKYLSEEGKEETVVMGCYGIGVERAMASIVEAHHDDRGIIWPVSVAPFDLVVLPLGADDVVKGVALEVAKSLGDGFEVILDDREETAGVKFADSELLGFPLRVVVSKKLVEKGEVEIKVRRSGEVVVVKKEKAVDEVRSLLEKLAMEEGGN